MKQYLYYTFTKEFDGINYVDFAYPVDYSFEDVLRYEYEKLYLKKYNQSSWYLEDGAKEFVKDMEKRWYNNTLDVDGYFTFNFDFRDWLHDEYRDEALKECLSRVEYFTEDYYEVVKEFNE